MLSPSGSLGSSPPWPSSPCSGAARWARPSPCGPPPLTTGRSPWCSNRPWSTSTRRRPSCCGSGGFPSRSSWLGSSSAERASWRACRSTVLGPSIRPHGSNARPRSSMEPMTRSSRSPKHAAWPMPSPHRPAGSTSPARNTPMSIDIGGDELLDRIAAFLDETTSGAATGWADIPAEL